MTDIPHSHPRPEPGQIIKDGTGSINIGAPIINIVARQEPPAATPPSVLATMLRHLKGILASGEELRSLLEKQEKDKKE